MDNHPNTEHETEEITNVYECQFCENKIQQFIPWSDNLDFSEEKLEMWNKNTAICPHCLSMDRERLYRLYIEEETDLTKGAKRVLHLGLEPCLRNWLIKMWNIQYSGGYVTSESGSRQLDMTNLDYPDETFDVVICSHVLESVPDDLKAMQELHRVLKKDGWAIIQVPIALHAKEIQDSIRIYRKKEFVKRLEMAGFTVKPFNFVQTFGEKVLPDIFKYGLSSKDTLYTVAKNKLVAGSSESVRSGALGSSSETIDSGLAQQVIFSFNKAWRKFLGSEA